MSATVPRPEPLPATAPLTAATVRGWQAQGAEVDRRLAPCFRRPEARQRAGAYVDGLLSDTRRKNGWQLAETAGDATPYGFQHLLGRADWSADALPHTKGSEGLFSPPPGDVAVDIGLAGWRAFPVTTLQTVGCDDAALSAPYPTGRPRQGIRTVTHDELKKALDCGCHP